MTGLEMQEYFTSELTKWKEKTRIDSRDIYYWLNSAQDNLVEELFAAYEQDGDLRQIRDQLAPLFVKNTAAATTYVGEVLNGMHCDEAAFPSDYQYFIAARASTALTGSPAQTVGVVRSGTNSQLHVVRLVQSDDVWGLLEDSFHKPQKRKAIADITEGDLEVYTDSTFVVTSVTFDYIKTPATITSAVSSELPVALHDAIVSRAVSLFLNRKQEVLQKDQSNSLEKLN